MNKLTLAATLALAMGGYAMAQVCGDLPQAVTTCNPMVYDFTVKVKTTLPKHGKVVEVTPCSDDKEVSYACFRVKGSRTLKGFIASCDSWCCENVPAQPAIPFQPAIPAIPAIPAFPGVPELDNDGLPVLDADGNPVWIEEPRDAVPEVPEVPEVPAQAAQPATIVANFNADRWTVYLWEPKTRNVYAAADAFEWDAFWRIGKNNRDLETSWLFDGDFAALSGMGWGSADKGYNVKSMSGNVIGWLEAPWIEKGAICCEAFPFSFCEIELEDVDTIAFGTWKMKYNAKASAASKSGILPLPKWW